MKKDEKILKIAIKEFPPLVTKQNNNYSGFEVELWESIAREAGFKYKFVHSEIHKIFDQIRNKEVDVGFGGLSITYEREKIVDFSHHTLNSGLQILVPSDAKVNFKQTIKSLFNKNVINIFSLLIGFVIIAAHLLWLVEKGSTSINDAYFPGILEALWWGIVTVSTVGYGDFTPETWLGRLIGAVVILLGLALFGIFISKLSSVSIAKKLKANIIKNIDLKGKHVATKKHSTSIKTLQHMGIDVTGVKNIATAIERVKKGKLDAVVYDAPVLQHYLKNHPDENLETTGELFEGQTYGFAVESKAPIREDINIALLKIRKSGEYNRIYDKWFGQDSHVMGI